VIDNKRRLWLAAAGRNEDILDIDLEAMAIDRAVEHKGRDSATERQIVFQRSFRMSAISCSLFDARPRSRAVANEPKLSKPLGIEIKLSVESRLASLATSARNCSTHASFDASRVEGARKAPDGLRYPSRQVPP
jgi:hypothetical protein